MLKKIISFIIAFSMIFSMVSFSTFAADELILITFENESEGWKPWSVAGKDLTTFTTDAYTEGKQSVLCNDNSTSNATGLRSKMASVTPGETYTALCDMLLVDGTVNFYVRFYDASNKALTNLKGIGTKGEWKTIALTGKAPEGAVTADIYIATIGGATGLAYIDNMKLVKGTVEPGKPDGKVPATLPKQEEQENKPAEIVDDGVKEGDIIASNSFENGLGGWSYWGAGAEEYVTNENDASDGKKSYHVVDPEAAGAPGLQSNTFPVSEGHTYTFMIDSKVVSGTTKIFVKFQDASGAQIYNKSQNLSGVGWTTMTSSHIAPAGAKTASVTICGLASTTGDAYVDNFVVKKGKVVPVMKDIDFIPPTQKAPVNATLVAPVDNKLVYNPYNANGDTAGDYSAAGFYAGQFNLPESKNIPVVMTVSPTGTKDDTKMLQDAIDKVYNESSDNTFKAIKLKAGRYNINKNGIMLKSGIVLSGEGQGPTGTEIYAYEPVQYTVVKVSGNNPILDNEKLMITDDYVKAGSNKIHLSETDAAKLKAGDLVTLTHPATEEWAKLVEMTGIINSSGQDSSWGKNNQNHVTERTVTAVNGTEITFDIPVFIPLMKNVAESFIQKTTDDGKIENVGIENLRIVSYYNGDPNDEKHATNAISVTNAKNIFVRDVTSKYFYGSLISSGKKAKQVTALNCSSIEPVSQVSGSRRYSFATSTSCQQILYTGCYSSKGRHDYETSFEVSGPIVFLDSVADESFGGIETHGTWAAGILYDNIFSVANDTAASIGVKNHGIYGSSESQGWTGVSTVLWNCLAPAIIVHRPPEPYQNFMVGSWGIYEDAAGMNSKLQNIERYIPIYRTTSHYNADRSVHFATKEGSPFVGDGYVENEFTPVEPRSLFKAQLSEKHTGTIANARPNAPIIINPKYDKTTDDKKVEINGIAQLGATKVNVYFDDVKYEAPVAKDNSFSIVIDAKEGVHKIYATQVIGGIEGVKNADRFITIGKANGNPEYLNSIYSVDKTSLLINDPRPTYDVYEAGLKTELADKITVMVNGAKLVSDVEPFETNDRVLVPMRAIFEALEATVTWDEATATATAVKEGTTVKITENKKETYVNDKLYELDVPAMIKDGRFVVPVRFISESFGCKVDWLDARKTVVIQGGGILYPAAHELENELDIADLVQSGDDGAGSVIPNVTDNDYATKWGVLYDPEKPEGAYGIFDLGKSKNISSMHIAFSAGDKRVYTIDIYSSDDGVNFTPVKMGHKSTGTTAQFEEIPLNIKARHIKIVGKGNSVNNWLNLQEVAFTGN